MERIMFHKRLVDGKRASCLRPRSLLAIILLVITEAV